MSLACKPNRSHHVIWATNMTTKSGETMPVVQCNVRSGFPPHKKTTQFLIKASFRLPVVIIQEHHCRLLSFGRYMGTWHEDDFISLDFEGVRVTGFERRDRSEVLPDEEAEQKWRKVQLGNLQVTETNPDYARTQLEYLESKL